VWTVSAWLLFGFGRGEGAQQGHEVDVTLWDGFKLQVDVAMLRLL